MSTKNDKPEKSGEPIVSKTKTSQSQQESPFALPFDPMEAFNRLTQENLARVQAFYDELATWEARGYDRAKAASEQLADLASESFSYMTNLAAEWRKLGLEATRRGVEMFKSQPGA